MSEKPINRRKTERIEDMRSDEASSGRATQYRSPNKGTSKLISLGVSTKDAKAILGRFGDNLPLL